MSYEKKLKDLLGRLVAMSPEPPPYPEEMPMASVPKTTRRPHPALVFAGAVVVIALLAVPVFLFTGDGPPVGVGPSTTTTAPQAATSEPSTSETTAPDVDTTVPETTIPATSTWQGTVFLYQTPGNSVGGNPGLVAVEIEVIDPSTRLDTDSYFTDALAVVDSNLPEGLSNSIPAEVRVVDAEGDGNMITVDMNEAFLSGAGGLLADVTMLNQLIYTLTYRQPDAAVLFTVNGQPIEAFGSEGLILTDPVDRETFRDDYLGQILVTEPITETDQGYQVSGLSRVYEANVVINVLDSNDDAVYEEIVQATCGTGCWGEYRTTIDSELITPGQSSMSIFTYSAKDGQPSEIITVPIPEDGIWSLTAE